MSGFKSPAKTFTLTHKDFPSWEEGSFWQIRSELTGDDADTIAEQQKETVIGDIDPLKVRELLANGDDGAVDRYVREQITEHTKMSTEKATLAHMSVRWGGPHFTLPEDFRILTDKGSEKVHPLAGTVPPCTSEFIGLLDSFDRQQVYRKANAIWAGRKVEVGEITASFPGTLPSEGDEGRESRAPVPLKGRK